MTDQAQAIVNKYAYDSFGNVANQVEAVSQPFKFVGQYGVMTEPNGFYYMRARYYDPNVGRFISEDPIGFDGGDVNLYAYVGNNPVNLIDPHGEDAISTTLGFLGYVSNTAGMIYKPAKVAGIIVSGATILYSGVQYKLGNMTGSEAVRNISLAAADIASVGIAAAKPLAGIITTNVTRALGIVNTAHDAVTTIAGKSGSTTLTTPKPLTNNSVIPTPTLTQPTASTGNP
jgi:RHS repeat-associated protein